jgi:hypothetical protein
MNSHRAAASADSVQVEDIFGLWEVIRISREDSVIYPWIVSRFRYDFQPEMNFLCLQNGQNSHGTWKLSQSKYESQARYSIVLNDTFEFTILDLDEDEITFTDHINKYLLARKL